MATAMKFPAVLADENARLADGPPAATLVLWMRAMVPAGGRTVNATPLLGAPFTVTTTFPVVAPAGTGATMLVADQLVGVAAVPLNFTVLEPCIAPKFEPVIVMAVPTSPLVGATLVILGGAVTVKPSPLLAMPATV